MKKGICWTIIALTMIYSSFANAKFVAIGDQWDESKRYASDLFIMKGIKNDEWRFNTKIDQLPQSEGDYKLLDVDCNSGYCVASGDYYSMSLRDYAPLLLSSQDAGKSWHAINSIEEMPINFKYLKGVYTTVHCSDTLCIVGGIANDPFTKNGKTYPLIVSKDKGITWSPANIMGLTKSFHAGGFACHGTRCIAYDNSNYLHSIDGVNWSFHTLPFDNIVINQVAVSDDYFLARSSVYIKNTPVLLTSTDGINFTINENIKFNERFTDFLTCRNNLCVMGGIAKDPVVWVSQDGGRTWREQKMRLNLPNNAQGITMQKAACNSNACSIIGYYDRGHGSLPLLLILDIKNQVVTSFALSDDLNLHDINCTDKTCTISASREDEHTDKETPYLLQSNEFLRQWTPINDPFHQQTVTSMKPTAVVTLSD